MKKPVVIVELMIFILSLEVIENPPFDFGFLFYR